MDAELMKHIEGSETAVVKLVEHLNIGLDSKDEGAVTRETVASVELEKLPTRTKKLLGINEE